MAPLKELSAVSTTLNDKSNKVTALLNEFQRKLCAMNLGVEAWVTSSPLTETLRVERYQGSILLDSPKHQSHDEQLGFGPLGDKWGLLVRTVILERSQYEANIGEGYDWDLVDEGTPTALLQASRPTRIAALSRLDALVRALTAKAEKVVKSIDSAEETINAL